MSSSLPVNIPYVLELVVKNMFSKVDLSSFDRVALAQGDPVPLPPFKVLDVGCGFGKWGFLLRDTFDVMFAQRFNKPDWILDITGIEPFEKCITPIQQGLYNRIIAKYIRECESELEKYDLVIFGDVIEHFDKEEGYKVLDMLFKYSNNIIVSTPYGFMPQGAWAGNEREIHRSGWKEDDFKTYNVVEYKILEDTLFKDMISSVPNIPEELKQPLSLLVLWLKK